ncbi:uncharacterized protein N7515_001596 [Penicillium bovifimosum]|uniref:Nephrocystin 3-like N-terminal domain-containing protein n=1 Tax=Penicillium bovifimosum TaxID=126998 RepID=A0A9W9HA07_9EURO|nr:uncharacterized protein N7515_001596 [Penicillium bovifimosum]KAJ5142809.1 hypothetical protein N7515_001596 [Penicillium bovifimosum]
MDPISITGLVIEVSHVLSSLIRYAKTAQNAKPEVRKLSEELFTLKGILEHLAAQSEHTPKWQESDKVNFDRDVMGRVLHTTNELIQSLLAGMETAETKFKRLKQTLKWPFTQKEILEHLTRLERVKSWLILVLMADQNSADRDIQHELRDLTSAVKEDLQIRVQERNQVANKLLFQWMAPVSPESSHLRASKSLKIGTGGWFVDGHLRKFLDQDEKRALFLVGKSGTGKSTLFAQAADKLIYMASQSQSMCVAYFYCTIGDHASQSARNVLGSFVAQLSSTFPSILQDIRYIYNKGPNSQASRFPVEMSALEAAIAQCAREKAQVVLCVDAINESHEAHPIETSLLKLASLYTNIRVIITTTNTMGSALPQDASVLNISGKSRGDIYSYIQHRLKTDNTLRDLGPEFKEEIEMNLLRDADGSFRWVQVSLDNLSTQRSVRAMRQALQNLPGTLRETYATMLERIAPDDWKLVREALFWISFSKKPLDMNSLNEIVVLDETCNTLDEDMMLVPPHILLQICQGLITEAIGGYLTLAHSSVKDFLTSDWIHSSRVRYFFLDPATAEAKAMHSCLSYLCLDNFTRGYLTVPEDPWKLRNKHPFLTYAANFWPSHGIACNFGDHQDMVHKFFATRHLPGRGNYGTWIQTLFKTTAKTKQFDNAAIDSTHPLYYAASFGMAPVVKSILESEPDIDVNAPGGRTAATPVWIASLRFNFEVVELLLRAGADPTIRDPGSGLNVLDLLRMVPTKHRDYKELRAVLARPAPWNENFGNAVDVHL